MEHDMKWLILLSWDFILKLNFVSVFSPWKLFFCKENTIFLWYNKIIPIETDVLIALCLKKNTKQNETMMSWPEACFWKLGSFRRKSQMQCNLWKSICSPQCGRYISVYCLSVLTEKTVQMLCGVRYIGSILCTIFHFSTITMWYYFCWLVPVNLFGALDCPFPFLPCD